MGKLKDYLLFYAAVTIGLLLAAGIVMLTVIL